MQSNVAFIEPQTAPSNAVIPDFVERKVEAYYRHRVRETWNGGHIMRGRVPGENDLLLVSNDYLSIARHPHILQSQREALLASGNGLLMSGIFLHGDNPQHAFEMRLAEFLRAENTVLCQSGWCANTGLIQALADEGTPVYVDLLAHMSLWEGIKSAGATARPFRHNDPGHLESQLCKYGPGIVVVDSVYSTNGGIAPLKALADLASRHTCVMVVDESHSLGTHGCEGEGLVAALGLVDKVQFRTASLAKAFAGRAGLITCSERFADYFKFTSRPAIFSSTLLPHELAALDATLEVIRKEGWRRQRLARNAAYLRGELARLGYNVQESESQIIALEAGPEQQTIVLRDALESRGVFGSVFCAPATAANRSLIRLSINAALEKQDLQRIVATCADIREEVDLENWPSTRRLRRRALPLACGA